MKFSLADRESMWHAEMDDWESRTENYRDYGLGKAMQLDRKYLLHLKGLVAIKKSRHKKRAAPSTLAN